MSTDIPTIGHMLRKAGYYTAYKGKWHLNREFDQHEPEHLFTKEMEEYGFADYASPGDLVGHTLGGYQFDDMIADSAIAWLRRKGRPLNDEGKPWSLTISLVNPHDIMYFSTDAPGKLVQDSGRLLFKAAPAPHHEFTRRNGILLIPESLTQPFDAPGRPPPMASIKGDGTCCSQIPPEEERWRRFNDFYVNSIRAVDEKLTGS
jgi:arylsulfatase